MFMKKISLFFIPVFIATILFSSGCKKDKQNTNEFVIEVDSIHVADTITFGDTLDIEFFGTIGPNGCYTLNRFDAGYSEDSILITAIGVFSGDDVCPDMISKLDGTILQIINISPGDYILAVNQPDDSQLTRDLRVDDLPSE
jgi:hypothetical protein